MSTKKMDSLAKRIGHVLSRPFSGWGRQPPFVCALGLIVIFLALLAAVMESAARSDFIRGNLPAPVIACGHHKLDIKLALLEDLIKKKGRVDCIFIGGSIVNAAVNPELFSLELAAHTGEKPVCFNFGLDAFIPPLMAIIAKILVEKYKPRLLVWGISPASLGQGRRKKFPLAGNPWVRYRWGDFNFKGWLIEHSYAYRYFLRFLTWLEQPQYAGKLARYEAAAGDSGFREHRKQKFIPLEPDPERTARLLKRMANFKISQKSTAALEQVIGLHGRTEIVMVEMPLHPSLLSLKAEVTQGYAKAAAYIGRQAKQRRILFLPTRQLELIPENGWRNSNHMNLLGARSFSLWLGKQVGRAIKQGLIKKADGARTL